MPNVYIFQNNKDKRLVFKDVNVTVDRNYGLGSAEVVYQNGYGVVDFNFTVTKIVPAERSFVSKNNKIAKSLLGTNFYHQTGTIQGSP